MKTKKRALLVIGAPEPKYSCTRCTSSCRRPFGVPVEPECAHQILTSSGLRPFLSGAAPKILASGWLPMIERDFRAACVFLEEEGSCAIWRELGRVGLPKACREYPLSRVLDENGELRLAVERGCSGVGVGADAKTLEGPERKVAPRLGLSSGKTLIPAEYGRMIRVVEEVLAAGDVRDGLRSAYRYAEAVSAALESGADKDVALELVPPSGADRRFAPRWLDRILFQVVVGNFAEFGEVPFRSAGVGFFGRLRFLARSFGWAFGFGKARVFGGGLVARRRLRKVDGVFEGESGRLVAAYLLEVVGRRTLFVRSTYFTKALVELGLALGVLGVVARARALARGERRVAAEDTEAAIAFAESFLGAQLAGQTLRTLEHLRSELLADEAAFCAFLDTV